MKISPANSGSVQLTEMLPGGREGQTVVATSSSQSYDCFGMNNIIRATAQAGSGYRFDRWSLEPSQSNFSIRSNPTEFKNVDATKTLTVYFTGGTAAPPNPPTNVQASKGAYSDRIRVTWNASSGATSYQVYRATSSGGAKSQIATRTTTSYDDFNITCPTTYYYWVKAVSSAGASDFSASSSGNCRTGTTPPPPPPSGDVTPVSVADAKKMLDEKVGLIVVDVSDLDQYNREHILCARHAFYNDFFGFYMDYDEIGLTPYKASDLLVYDQKNLIGQTAAEYLAGEGFSSVYYLVGGLDAWMAAGHETVPCSYECGTCDLPPMAHAGPDQTVSENQTFTLDGSGSVNPGAGSLTYSWSQYKGTRANMTNSSTAKPTVTAPSVQEGGETLSFHLTVTDAQGNKDMDSVQVKVNWAFENRPPTARAGVNQEVESGVEVVLDGTGSTDPDDGIDKYQWTQTDGPTVPLTGASTAVARFEAPTAESEPVMLKFELTVTDKGGLSHSDEVTITVSVGNQPPVADAGEDQIVGETARVTLDGSGSYDEDGDTLFYEWRQVGGSKAVELVVQPPAKAVFTAPMVSGAPLTLTFELTVRDNQGGEDRDRVEITVEDVGEPPFADAGRSQMAYEGDKVTLDGSGSFDIDGDITSYLWEQVNHPAVVMIGETTAKPSFMAPYVEEGQIALIFQLTVTDDAGLTDSDTVKVAVNSGKAPPQADAGPDQVVHEGDTVTLNGSAGTYTLLDTDASYPRYRWEQISGPDVNLSDPAARAPEFKAPKVATDLTVLAFALEVEYADGHKDTDTVDVYIKKKNCSSSSTCFISTLNDNF